MRMLSRTIDKIQANQHPMTRPSLLLSSVEEDIRWVFFQIPIIIIKIRYAHGMGVLALYNENDA